MKADFDLAKGIWFPVIVSIVLILIVIFMPKRIKFKEIYITYGIVGFIVSTIDIVLAVPFDLFDLGSGNKRGLPELLFYGVIPPCLAVIYCNYYKIEKKWIHAVLFIVLSFAIEWLSVKVGIMTLNAWNTLWSLPVHIIFYAFFMPWHLKFIRD